MTQSADPVKSGKSVSKDDPKSRPMPMHYVHNTYWLGGYFILISIILTMFIFMLWPRIVTEPETTENKSDTTITVTKSSSGTDTAITTTLPVRPNPGKAAGNAIVAPNEDDNQKNTWKFFGRVLPISYEARLILLILLAGALGSCIYAATSFATYAGNRKLISSWLWWYLLRPFIGGPLALIFYLVIRGGFLTTGADATSLSIYGITGLSALVGMFSKNAIDKLQEVFETLFRSKEGKGDDARTDKSLDQIMVEGVMIPVNKITSYDLENKQLSEITLEEIYNLLKGVVTRVPVVTHENKLKYIIHQSILYQYIANQNVVHADKNEIFKINESYLEDFINDPKINDYVEKSIVLVSLKASLNEAKQAMEATKNCQDVFVTETGSKEEPLLGWLTNVDIARNLAG